VHFKQVVTVRVNVFISREMINIWQLPEKERRCILSSAVPL